MRDQTWVLMHVCLNGLKGLYYLLLLQMLLLLLLLLLKKIYWVRPYSPLLTRVFIMRLGTIINH